MTDSQPTEPLLSLPWRVGLVAAAGFAVAVHFLGPALPYDDAFITFRYVDHLVGGNGLVYNLGERVFGASTPLYVFWLAALKWMVTGVATPLLAVRSNLLLFLLAAAGLYAVSRELSGTKPLSAALAILFLVNPQLLAVSLGGMETIGAVALVLGAAAAALAARPVLFGLLAGLAVVMRPEGAILVAPFGLAFWLRATGWRPRALAAALAVLPGFVWLLAATVYFGSPIPHSVVAKAAPLYPLEPLAAATRIVGWLGTWLTPGPLSFARPVGAATAVALLAMTSMALIWHRQWKGGLGAYLLGAPLVLYASGNPLFFEWYWPIVIVPALLVLGVGGMATADWFPAPSVRWRAVAVWAMPGLVALVTVSHYATPASQMSEPIAWHHIEEDPTRLRIVGYAAAAKRLNRLSKPTERVAAPEIGALGYFYHGRISDACGLVSPEAVPFLPVPAEQRLGPMFGAISIEFVQATQPDWVVTMPVFALKSLLASPWFEARYSPVEQVPLPARCWGSGSVVLFRRK